MNSQPDVVCIGQALVDCITRGKEPYKERVFRAKSISLSLGGDALNEASLLAKMGVNVKIVCGVGHDLAGDLVVSTVKERGIDSSGIVRRKDIVTPIANLMVDTDGSRISYNSPATMLGEFIPDPACIKGARIISLASMFRAPLDQKEAIISLIKEAKRQGMLVCADTKIPTYRQISLEDIKEALPMIDYIFPNEGEAQHFTGLTDFADMARCIHDMGVRNVIVKTGKYGCTVCGQDGIFDMKSMATEAKDSTGAGDSFVSGFIHGLLANKSLYDCCNEGMALAAQCVQHSGAYWID